MHQMRKVKCQEKFLEAATVNMEILKNNCQIDMAIWCISPDGVQRMLKTLLTPPKIAHSFWPLGKIEDHPNGY